MLIDLTVRQFLEETSAGNAVPGGGSIAALCGALGAALAAMVAHLTIGKKGYEESSDRMRVLAETALRHREGLMACVDQDAQAYREVMKAMKLPRNTEDEKAARNLAIQNALKIAAAVPLQVAREAMTVMAIIAQVIEKGNRNALSDGLAGVLVIRAAVRAALYNVRINLQSISDPIFVTEARTAVNGMEAEIEEEEKRILAMVE